MIAVNIYDGELNRIGTLETWISLIWDEEYRDEGRFQLEVWATSEATRLLKEDVFCGVTGSRTLAVIKSVSAHGKKLVFSGTMAVGLLKDRVSTRRVSNENAESALRSVVSGMQAYPPIALGTSAGLTDKFAPEIRDMDVLEYARQICAETDIGFTLRHDRESKKLLFECYKPDPDENARYATAYGNLGDIRYSRSTVEYKNVAVIINTYSETVDEVTKENRQVIYAGNTSASGADRREMVIQMSSQPEENESKTAFAARLKAEGEAALIEAAKIENIQFEVDDDRAQLGDVITVLLPELHTRMTVRVIGVMITSQKNKTTREISVGTPILRKNPIRKRR